MPPSGNQRSRVMVNVTYISGSVDLLDKIKPLWQELNKHNLNLSPHFKDCYKAVTFEDRKQAILQKADGGELKVDVALNAQEVPVGYCVSTLNLSKTGEIESIFIDENFRHLGVGDTLMREALSWMDSKGAISKVVEVVLATSRRSASINVTVFSQEKQC